MPRNVLISVLKLTWEMEDFSLTRPHHVDWIFGHYYGVISYVIQAISVK